MKAIAFRFILFVVLKHFPACACRLLYAERGTSFTFRKKDGDGGGRRRRLRDYRSGEHLRTEINVQLSTACEGNAAALLTSIVKTMFVAFLLQRALGTLSKESLA